MLAFHDHSRRLPHRRRPQPPFSIIQQALSSSASNTIIHRRSNTPNPPTIEGTSNPSPPVYIQSISEHHELPLARSQSDSEIEVAEVAIEAGNLGIVGEDAQDFEDGNFNPAPGVKT
ncbi:hypothetical protein U1Q18_031680, partial [Sarracenia purpurea var. burkii]